MNNTTDLTTVHVHFDDAADSFTAFQNNRLDRYNLFITDATYRRLQKAGDIDGEPTASDYAPFVERQPVHLRDISGWEVNFND